MKCVFQLLFPCTQITTYKINLRNESPGKLKVPKCFIGRLCHELLRTKAVIANVHKITLILASKSSWVVGCVCVAGVCVCVVWGKNLQSKIQCKRHRKPRHGEGLWLASWRGNEKPTAWHGGQTAVPRSDSCAPVTDVSHWEGCWRSKAWLLDGFVEFAYAVYGDL